MSNDIEAKEEIRRVSHPNIDNLAPPPRRVPLPVRCHITFGGMLNQMGWFFFAFGSILFWIFVINCEAMSWFSFRGPLKTCQGVVTSSEKSSASEGGSKHRKGTPIWAIHYTFKEGKNTYQGCSYAVGRSHDAGAPVTVEYAASDPRISRISGYRSRVFSAAAGVTLLFPLVGLAFLVPGWLTGRKARRLLENGIVATGVLKAKEPTSSSVNKQTVYKLTFEFNAADGRTYEAVAKTHETQRLQDEAGEKIVYDPADPTRAVVIDGLPGSFRVTADGQIESDNSRGALMVTLVPLLALFGNGAYAIIRLF
ncbi:MAG TPA: DUF3592 domain-containing protein [Planctomycetota bacterium]|nr:DUF3592 domain-containing protein [Planctomycetota bacterium]